MKHFMSSLSVQAPRVPVFSNVDGGERPLRRAGDVRQAVARQVVAQVKWEQTMHNMFARTYEDMSLYPSVYECGPGKGSLCSMLSKLNGKAGKKCSFVNV